MSIPLKWRKHIEAWQQSGLSQTEYCYQQQLNARTFTARLSDYRKQSDSNTQALLPVQITPDDSSVIVLSHAQGYRLELPGSTSAAWLAELLKCLG